MNPQVKEKWLNALRSGEYQQTQTALRKEDGFCCLGVLCDLYIKEKNEQWVWDGDSKYGIKCGSKNVYYSHLPRSVMEWAGLRICCDPFVFDNTLSELNDGGSTFKQIADLIKEHL